MAKVSYVLAEEHRYRVVVRQIFSAFLVVVASRERAEREVELTVLPRLVVLFDENVVEAVQYKNLAV